jgi:hypothetical protein
MLLKRRSKFVFTEVDSVALSTACDLALAWQEVALAAC